MFEKYINEFTKRYQPLAYVIKEEDGTIVADTTSILKPDIPDLNLLEEEVAIEIF